MSACASTTLRRSSGYRQQRDPTHVEYALPSSTTNSQTWHPKRPINCGKEFPADSPAGTARSSVNRATCSTCSAPSTIPCGPSLRQLSYLDALAASPEVAQAVKAKVWLQLEDLAKDVVDRMRAAGTPIIQVDPPSKKLKFTAPPDAFEDCSDFFDTAPDRRGESNEDKLYPLDAARQAMEEWNEWAITENEIMVYLPAVAVLRTFT